MTQEPITSTNCKICNKELIRFLDLGQMPIANALLRKEDLNKKEFFYRLDIGYCSSCYMVQMFTTIPYEMYLRPDENKKRNYVFFSSTSDFMKQHFKEWANEISNNYLKENSLVIDIGSNDGILLQNFDRNNFKVLGIEPANNVADVAIQKGIPTIIDYMNEAVAKKILQEKGKARAIASANVILNIADLNELMRCIDILLEKEGIFTFEDPYLPVILENNTYDQFYDEHVYYFTTHSIKNLVEEYNMELFDAKFQEVHGGSMRFYIKRKSNSSINISDNVNNLLKKERDIGIDSGKAYNDFNSRVQKNKNELISLLKKLKSEGKRIVGYGAASKGVIITNFCNITPELVGYISDNTPAKQGLYYPGVHIPIVHPDNFHNDKPDYALVFAWNHIKEIMAKEQEFIKNGGKFIIPFPNVQILP